MRIPEFLTYCTMMGFVKEHNEVEVPAWDVDAEKYFLVSLKGRAYTASIRYATIGEGACILECGLVDHGHKFEDGRRGSHTIIRPDFSDIKDAFIPKKQYVFEKDDA